MHVFSCNYHTINCDNRLISVSSVCQYLTNLKRKQLKINIDNSGCWKKHTNICVNLISWHVLNYLYQFAIALLFVWIWTAKSQDWENMSSLHVILCCHPHDTLYLSWPLRKPEIIPLYIILCELYYAYFTPLLTSSARPFLLLKKY